MTPPEAGELARPVAGALGDLGLPSWVRPAPQVSLGRGRASSPGLVDKSFLFLVCGAGGELRVGRGGAESITSV